MGHKSQLEKRIKQIEKGFLKGKETVKIKHDNHKVILNFINNYCKAHGLSSNRILKYIRYLVNLSVVLDKNLLEAEKEDLIKIVSWVESHESFAPWTKSDIKSMIKKFYRVMEGEDEEVPKKARWIKPGVKKHEQPEIQLLSKQEIEKILDVCESHRDTAIILWLYTTGARPGEFSRIKIKDIDIGKTEIHLNLSGKTGSRRIAITDSIVIESMINWLNHHPDRENQNAYIWFLNGNSLKQPSLASLGMFVKRLCKKAGIKQVPAKIFRKSRATHMAADGFSAFQLMSYFGWSEVDTPLYYVKLSGSGLSEKLREKYGNGAGRTHKASLEPKKCWYSGCEHINKSTNRWCEKCGRVLELKNTSLNEKHDIVDKNIMSVLLKRPTVQRAVEDEIRNDEKLRGLILQMASKFQ